MQLPIQTLPKAAEQPRRGDAPVVFEVHGELDLHTEKDFETTVCGHLHSGSVIVDLSELEFLSISSLRSLLVCRRSATAAARRLDYVGAPGQARRLVAVAGLEEELALSAAGSSSS